MALGFGRPVDDVGLRINKAWMTRMLKSETSRNSRELMDSSPRCHW